MTASAAAMCFLSPISWNSCAAVFLGDLEDELLCHGYARSLSVGYCQVALHSDVWTYPFPYRLTNTWYCQTSHFFFCQLEDYKILLPSFMVVCSWLLVRITIFLYLSDSCFYFFCKFQVSFIWLLVFCVFFSGYSLFICVMCYLLSLWYPLLCRSF